MIYFRHIPKAKHTTVAETPELKRLAENTKLQSNVSWYVNLSDFQCWVIKLINLLLWLLEDNKFIMVTFFYWFLMELKDNQVPLFIIHHNFMFIIVKFEKIYISTVLGIFKFKIFFLIIGVS